MVQKLLSSLPYIYIDKKMFVYFEQKKITQDITGIHKKPRHLESMFKGSKYVFLIKINEFLVLMY